MKDLFKTEEYQRVTVKAKAIKIGHPVEVTGGLLKQQVTITDVTGTTHLVLWEKDIDSLVKGESYQFSRLLVSIYMGQHYLSLPKSGAHVQKIEDVANTAEDNIQEDDENHLIKDAKIIGVSGLDTIYSCFNCKKGAVKPNCPKFGTCEDCNTFQRLDNAKVTCKLVFMNGIDKVSLRAYEDVLKVIVQQDPESKTPIMCENLVMAPAFNIEHNKCHIIKSVSRENKEN